jgi:hypothetical protein
MGMRHQLVAVQYQKRFHGGVPDALVAVEKYVVLNQRKAQCTRLRDRIRAQLVTIECEPRLCKRGLEQAKIT